MKPNSIEFYRKQKKLSQTKLGKLIGKSLQAVSGYERGVSVTTEVWAALSKNLGATVDQLKALPPVNYRIPTEVPDPLLESTAPEWLEFVEWLSSEIPLEVLRQKRDEAFHAKLDKFDDWLNILMRRRRDLEVSALALNEKSPSSAQDVADASASNADAERVADQPPGLPLKSGAVVPTVDKRSPSASALPESRAAHGSPKPAPK